MLHGWLAMGRLRAIARPPGSFEHDVASFTVKGPARGNDIHPPMRAASHSQTSMREPL